MVHIIPILGDNLLVLTTFALIVSIPAGDTLGTIALLVGVPDTVKHHLAMLKRVNNLD